MKNEKIIKKITQLILKNKQKMIREEDLKNLCEENDFDEIIAQVYSNLNTVGFELISTTFLDQKYYILTAEGKDDNISPSQYGTLALVLALSKQVDENIRLEDLKSMFSEVWDTDIEFLIKNDYLRKINIEGLEIIKVTPIGKAILKNVIQTIDLKNLLNIFKSE